MGRWCVCGGLGSWNHAAKRWGVGALGWKSDGPEGWWGGVGPLDCGCWGGGCSEYLVKLDEFIVRKQPATYRDGRGDGRRCASGARGHGHGLYVVGMRRCGGVKAWSCVEVVWE